MNRINKFIRNGIEKLKNGSYILRQLATHRKNSLFIKNLTVIMSLLAVLLLIYGINFYSKTQNNINEQLENSNLHILERVQDMGAEVLKTTETIATNVSIQNYTRQFFMTSDEESRKLYEESVDDMIVRYTSVYDYIDSIYVCSLDGKMVTSGKLSEDENVYNDTAFLRGVDSIKETLIVERTKNNVYPYLISFIRPVTVTGSVEDPFGDNKTLGLVCVNLNAEKFGKLLEKADYKKNNFPGVIVADNKGKILYSAQKEQIGLDIKEIEYLSKVKNDSQKFTYRHKNGNNRLIISANKSNYKDMIFVSIAEATDPWDIFMKMLQYILEGMIFVILASILAAGFFAYTSYRPIVRITQMLDSDEAITESLALREKSGEMQFIIENILNNMQKKNEMENEIKDRVVLLRKAMFTALQVQINPHFIYNTLENINWLAVKIAGNDNKVSSSILTLAKLMRYSLETEGYLVSVEDELKNARQYEALLGVRYPGTFEVHWNISDEVLDKKIIRLTLQPIIENAIQHGIRPKREKGLIEINCVISGENILITVEDDGIGMTHEAMDELNNSLSKEYLLESNHVGLRNVNQRLKIVFGESYGLKLSERDDGKQGMKVILTIPAFRNDYDNGNDMFLYGKKFNS